MSTNKTKYAEKRRSGNMMYGPGKPVPKWPAFRAPIIPKDKYWWGEKRIKPCIEGFTIDDLGGI